MASQNEYGNATEDFTHNHVVSNWFAESALICDPIKVQWWNLHQLNECHPSLVKIPTMVVSFDVVPQHVLNETTLIYIIFPDCWGSRPVCANADTSRIVHTLGKRRG
jgi:hypothetical protein